MTKHARDIFAAAERTLAVFRRHRYALLLGSLLLLMLSAPGVDALGVRWYPGLARLVMIGLFVIVLLSAAITVCDSRLTALVALFLALPTVVFNVLTLLVKWPPIVVLASLFGILFMGFTVAIGLRFLFRADRVSHGTIWASLCVYLMLGVVWADVYSTLYYLDSSSFTFSPAVEGSRGKMELWAQDSVVPLYYSFVTMTTLGYGDIVPSTPTARMLSALQSVVGQLYLAVLVARLVGLQISQSNRTTNSPDDPPWNNP